MAVITISRQFGSGGDEIAHRIAEILDYQIFDKRLVIKIATEMGLSEQEIVDYSEENHKVRGFLERLFAPTQLASEALIYREDAIGVYTEGTYLHEDTQLNLMQKAIRGAHDLGKMIILGRGGQAILTDQPDVLHIRVEAPMEERIQRVKEDLRQTRKEYYADLHLRREAQDMITTRDAASADYLKRFYHVDWADPVLYHLVINSGKISVEQAADLVAQLALAMPSKVTEQA